MPMYGDGDEGKKGAKDDLKNLYDASKDACNPDNFKDFKEEEIVIR